MYGDMVRDKEAWHAAVHGVGGGASWRESDMTWQLKNTNSNVWEDQEPGLNEIIPGTSLMAQWLRLHAAGEQVRSLVEELRSHMPLCGQKKRNHLFDLYLNHLWPVSCFSSSWSPSEYIVRGGCSGWWLDGWMTRCLQHPLFTVRAGDIYRPQCYGIYLSA